jgi:hypothetical protein
LFAESGGKHRVRFRHSPCHRNKNKKINIEKKDLYENNKKNNMCTCYFNLKMIFFKSKLCTEEEKKKQNGNRH